MNNVAVSYAAYLLISIGLTVWVARTLHKNGRVFLVDAFKGNKELADSVNHLLVVGFYLINIGYIAVALKTDQPMTTLREVIEVESVKLGIVSLILGAMHFFNILVFAKMRGRQSAPVNQGYQPIPSFNQPPPAPPVSVDAVQPVFAKTEVVKPLGQS